MKIVHSYFFLALYLAMVLPSCTEKNVVGVDVLPNQSGLNTTFTDTVTIISNTVKEDSLRTDTLFSKHLLGNYNDPVFGKSQASIYTQVLLPTNNVNFGDSLKLDSIVLTLAYNGFYGDTSIPQTVEVYELNEDLSVGNEYYSDQDFIIKPTLLGSKTFVPNLTDSVACVVFH